MTDIPVRDMVMNHEKAFQPDKAVGVEADIQYLLSGDEGGNWIVAIHNGECKVSEGIHPNPTSRIVAMSFCEPRSWTRVLSS